MLKVCSEPECPATSVARGLCSKHYQRVVRHGSAELQVVNKGRDFVLNVAMKFCGRECLIWPYSFSGQRYNCGGGYPTFSNGRGRRIAAHRMVCELTNGAPPSAHHQAAHTCGNSRCVNPSHLSWKTRKENAADKVTHNTHTRGERSWNAKINESDVVIIRKLYPSVSISEISRMFGISRSQTYNIVNRIKWSHVI